MEVELEDVPSQIRDVLGMLADYGAQNGHSQKKQRRELPSRKPSAGSDGEALPKMLSLMCQLILRHERDLSCLHQQNTFILFMSTEKDGLMFQILQTSSNWKQQQQQHQATQSLRQCLVLHVMQTLVQRVTKVMDCKKEDPLWQSSLQSKIVLQDSS